MGKISWGSTVRVQEGAIPGGPQPPPLAAVCGIRPVDHEDIAKEFETELGTRLLLLEFGDGDTVEVPERLVELVED